VESLTIEEIAERAGTSPETLRGYIERGVLSPDPAGMLQPPDTARARLVGALVDAGLDLDDLAAAISGGDVTLGYVDLLMPDPVRLVPAPTPGDGANPLSYEEMIRPILGTRRESENIIRADDLAILDVVARAVEIGAPIERVVRIIRTMAQTTLKLVYLQRDFIDDVLLRPAIEETGSPISALEVTSRDRYEYRELGSRLIELLLARFVDDAIFTNLVELTELALAKGGIDSSGRPESVVFVDVSNYTSLSESHGDTASAHQAVLLADFIHDLAGKHGCRLVKSLGDGAMVHCPDASSAVGLALDAVTGAEAAALWPLHAGVNTGSMVRRDGDFFGTAINIAARVSGEAGPGEVLVTRAIADAWEGAGVDFVFRGKSVLKNVGEPVPLYQAVGTLRPHLD